MFLECQKEGRVATGMLSAHAVVRRSWGVIPRRVLVFLTAEVFSPVITVANRFLLEASRGAETVIDETWSDETANTTCLSVRLENPLFRPRFGRDALQAEIITLVKLNLSGAGGELPFFLCSGVLNPKGTKDSPLIHTFRHGY